MSQDFDLVVIGAGPAGYTAAIRAAQLGMKVACVEKSATLGGTCLNVGCIPSKTLLHLSNVYYSLKKYGDFGIDVKSELDLSKMMAKKDGVIKELCTGIESLFSKNKIKRFCDKAVIKSENLVLLEQSGASLKTKFILIATGSEPIVPSFININSKNILTSSGALSIKDLPKKMVVMGGGYIGLELGSVWNKLGTQVLIVEYNDKLLQTMDSDVIQVLQKVLTQQGIQFALGSKVLGVEEKSDHVECTIQKISDQTITKIDADVFLVSTGRAPYTQGLGLENIMVTTDASGRIPVNQKYTTSCSSVFAVGDVINGPMLAHKAEEEAVAAVENMAGQSGHVNYNVIPSVIYTSPEVASVGQTEEQLKQAGVKYKIGKFPMLANSRARSVFATDGLVKVIACEKTDKILGAHIVGHDAGNLISEVALAMEFSACLEDVARTCHPHPTLSEALREACMAANKRAINC